MQENSFISFIVPVLNMADTLGKCLESIKNVDYPKDNFEIIVMDNGSSDSSIEIAKQFTDRIFIDSKATIAKLRNKGAKEAKGTFLSFVDADCIIPKDYLKDALGYFKDSNVGLVGSRTYIVFDNATWIEKTWKVHFDKDSDINKVNWLHSEAIVIKKDIFFAVGGFDGSLETCEDVDFGYRINKKYKIISDKKLAPLHLKDAKKITEFFKKESWRGKNSIQVSLKHLNERKEILSLALLFYYLMLLILLAPAIIITFIIKNIIYLASILLSITVPLAIISFNTCRRTKKFSYFWKFFLLYGVYILARVRTIFK